ncbi:MAG: peptidylprolyl isomerase [Oscillospiraceae bacterium]|jgi:cyclophilin family peptidyl-prolyl cis-trans isomerase|nr:peptidylprolyl isomerase [Oscillospiraceae bacterium]
MKKVKAVSAIAATLVSAFVSAACAPAEVPLIGVTDLSGGNTGAVKLEKGDKYADISIRDYGDIRIKLLPECAPVAVENFVDLAESGYYNGKKFHRVVEGFMIQGGSPNGDGMSDPNEKTFAVERAYNARHFYGALCMANSLGRNSQQFYIVNNTERREPADVNADYYKNEADNARAVIDKYRSEMDAETLKYYELIYNSNINTYNGMTKFRENLSDEIIEKYKSGGTPSLDGGYTVFGQTIQGFDVLDAVSAAKVALSDPDNPNSEKSKPVSDIIIESVKIYTYEG